MNNEIDYEVLNIDPDILKKAWDGDADSQLFLGKTYFDAVYTDDNCSNAFKWIHHSAEQGNMEAQYRLGNLFALGQGTSKSYTDAYEWYTKAALQGYRKALARIFNLYQQDRKMHCRGKLDSGEIRWNNKYFLKTNNVRELNEYRLKHHEFKLNHAIDYYTDLFNMLKSGNQDDPNIALELGFLYQYGFSVNKCAKLAIDYYTEAAKQGNRDAQYHLGYLYENDTDIKFNYRLALKWYRSSATNGNIAAQNALGYFYEKGFATELNFEDAVHWYTKAANAGNSDAQLTLGKLYRKGEGVNVDISQAIQWYTLAANQGNGAAQNCLNQLYRNRKTSQLSDISNNTAIVGAHQTKPTLRSKLQDDIEKMDSLPHIKQLKELAEHALRTDGNAMFTIGIKYYNGEDFTQDKEAGFQWIKRAAKAGLQKAELKVAEMYRHGNVVVQDYHESSIWTRKAVKKKSSEAQYTLGHLYLSGEGVRKNYFQTFKWFTKSADQGNSDAQYQFGLLKWDGLATLKDEKEATKWFNKSALNGNLDAIYKLGQLYDEGKHVEKDVYRAIEFYKYSANHGNHNSQLQLAEIYEKGELVDQDLQQAEKYYQLAANSDDYIQYQLARKYMEGAFGNSDYVKAFNLFSKIAVEEPSSHYNIFRTPISFVDNDMDYMKLVAMFKLVSERGQQKLYYNIGYLYENGGNMSFNPNFTHALHWYSTAAANGDARAKYRLGVMYKEGKGVKVDLATAYNYYSEAYENGIDAAYQLAVMYMNGKGVTQDLVKAYCLFTEASGNGNAQATMKIIPSMASDNLNMLEAVANAGYIYVQYQLGVFYQKHEAGDEKVFKWLTFAADGGVTDASYRLGVIYEELKWNDIMYYKAAHLYSEAIKKCHEDAMYRLAQMYQLGKGVNHDYQKAYDLYTMAADLGHMKSRRLLDVTNYSIGETYTENVEATVDEYSEYLKNNLLMIKFLANKGNNYLKCKLGHLYVSSKSHLDYNEAFKWYQMAAANGNANAIYQLGLLYENGKGTIQDYSMATRLYSQAKEQGNKDSIYRLGLAYHYGLGVDVDAAEAIHCYIKAAKLGSNESQYKLGSLYNAGELVVKDPLKALEWYTMAYINGNRNVINDLYQLYDEKPLELYFYERLFSILSKIENTYKSSSNRRYGFLYYRLGKMYYNGQGTVLNHAEALKHFLKAHYDYKYEEAEPFISLEYSKYEIPRQSIYLTNLKTYSKIQDQIPSEHQYKLGMVYYNGIQNISVNNNTSDNSYVSTVLVSDYPKAVQYFKLASLRMNPNAQDQLGLMNLRGHGVKKDYQMALKWFTAASNSMSDYECYYRGLDFYEGRNVEKDHKIAMIYLQQAAQKYETKTNTYLDGLYLTEFDVKKLKSEVKTYIGKIYLDKFEKGQFENAAIHQFEKEVGEIEPSLLYDRGIQIYKESSGGVTYHNVPAFFIKKAAEKNHSQAIIELGSMYLDGRAVEKEENEGIKWIERSIEFLNPWKCYQRGMELYHDKNYKISLLYIKKGAQENNGDAQAHLGLVHIQGLGVEKNYEVAMQWFKRSTMQLGVVDCGEKGEKFYQSVEIDKNYEIALLYLQKSSEDPLSRSLLGIMHLQGLGVEKEYNTALGWIGLAIKEMHYVECYNYGMMFYNGTEVAKNYTIALEILRKAADSQFGPAEAQIGLMHLYGYGVSKNQSEGMRWIEKAIENTNERWSYDIGIYLRNQAELKNHFGIAFIFIKKTAEKGYGTLQALLGEMYLEGKGVKKNKDEALKWIEQSTKGMGSFECYNQAMKHYNGSGVEKNYNVAMLYLQAAKHKKYTLVQAQIGILYLEGHGVEKSKERAMECFQQSIAEMDPEECYLQGIKFYFEYRYDIALLYMRDAAESGYAPAQSQLGIMLLEGNGTQKNQPEALNWISKSLESMTPNDCYDQGMTLYRGTTVAKDYTLSFRFMEKAAKNHHGLAQAQLGLVYFHGLGVGKSKDNAIKWVEESIKELSADKCYEQGMRFYRGTEIEQDYDIALLYIQKAAEYHHGQSQAQLALMYLEGNGVQKNHDAAMTWIHKSTNEMKLEECYRQGMIFYNRTDLENSYDIALFYLNRASKANAYAQAQLGYMYLNGIGVDQNHEEAARWHDTVENNYTGEARFCRSKIYHYGQDGMQDFSRAFNLYQEELECFIAGRYPDKSSALRGIGLLFEYGDGMTQDFKKALQYYRRSASDKNTTAYYDIGLLYYYGKGVDQNYKEAFTCFIKVTNSVPDPKKLHVFIEENNDDAKDITGSPKRTYSLLPEDRIFGEAHYYIGLMYNNGFFVDQDEERAQNYFKMAYIHGVERAKNLLK